MLSENFRTYDHFFFLFFFSLFFFIFSSNYEGVALIYAAFFTWDTYYFHIMLQSDIDQSNCDCNFGYILPSFW